jgi:DNA-binding NarL/FixJ family response regulator
MPGMDGFECCRRLKNDKLLAHLPVIFMTGLTDTEHVVAGLSAGGVDYVSKPIVIDELLARIRVHLANARAAQGTQAALDAAGRFLLATDRTGRLLWCTPKARQLLIELFPTPNGRDASMPAGVAERLLKLQRVDSSALARIAMEVDDRKVEFAFLSSTGSDELLFSLSEISNIGEPELLRQVLQLTTREAEVLLWISRGKSNRDIGEILGISPRTVNKHLEQVFIKLGVENRAAAAAQAVRILSRPTQPIMLRA